MPFFIKPIVLYVVAVVLLRLSGRRSISQMTISQTILVISLGNIIVEPFTHQDVLVTSIVATIFTILLVLFEVFEYHVKGFEDVMVGQEVVVIKEGVIDERGMKVLKLTKSELLSRLRQQGIEKIEHVKLGTLESNGELGYLLTKQSSPVTVKVLDKKMDEMYKQIETLINNEKKGK